MAKKAAKNGFVVGYSDDFDTLYTECIFTEKDAIDTAEEAIEVEDIGEITVYELVPRFRIKQAKATVEKL